MKSFGIISYCQKVIKLCKLNAEYFHVPLKFILKNSKVGGIAFNRLDVIGNVFLSHTYFWVSFTDFTEMILGLDQRD